MKHSFTGQAEIAFKRIMKETSIWKSRLSLEGVKPSKEEERQWRRDRILSQF